MGFFRTSLGHLDGIITGAIPVNDFLAHRQVCGQLAAKPLPSFVQARPPEIGEAAYVRILDSHHKRLAAPARQSQVPSSEYRVGPEHGRRGSATPRSGRTGLGQARGPFAHARHMPIQHADGGERPKPCSVRYPLIADPARSLITSGLGSSTEACRGLGA